MAPRAPSTIEHGGYISLDMSFFCTEALCLVRPAFEAGIVQKSIFVLVFALFQASFRAKWQDWRDDYILAHDIQHLDVSAEPRLTEVPHRFLQLMAETVKLPNVTLTDKYSGLQIMNRLIANSQHAQ